MRKFKVFISSILAYLMLISLVHTGIAERIVSASENDYAKLVKEGYYLKSNAQYNNKTLVTYTKNDSSNKDLYVALVENGKETVLKTEENCRLAFITNNNSSKVAIMYWSEEGTEYYEEFNFETLKFRSITKEEYDAFYNNNNNNKEYPVGYGKTLVQGIDHDRDEVIEEAFSKINKYNNGYNLTISDKEYLDDVFGLAYANDNGDSLRIYAYRIKVYNNDIKVSNNAVTLNIEAHAKGEVKNYRAVVTKNNAYIEEVEEYADSFDMGYYDGYYSLFLTRGLGDETHRLIEITNGDIVTNQVIDFGNKAIIKIDNNIYTQDYFNKTLKIYSKQGNEYKLSSEIECLASNLSYSKSLKLPTLIEKENGKAYVSQIVVDNIVKRVDITNEVEKFKGAYGYDVNIQGDSNGNYILENMNTFVVIQKVSKTEAAPQVPESDNTVTTEVSEIKPDDKNEIVVSTESEIKNIEVVVKDIESIKGGTGSLNIAINKDVEMNLPLSLIDKTILEGAENISVKLNVEENSEIIKELKAVKKVFDFNLVVNKENEAVNIHNFKEGVAEITFALTDEDLNGLNRDNLVVYYYNEETKEFEAMETKVEGNNVTFTTSHFSKYIISEKIADKDITTTPDKDEDTTIKPDADKDTTIKPDADKNEEVTIKPDADNTNDSTTNSDTTKNEESSIETGKRNLPNTGAVVSSNVILVIALGTVLVGTAIFFRRKKVA